MMDTRHRKTEQQIKCQLISNTQCNIFKTGFLGTRTTFKSHYIQANWLELQLEAQNIAKNLALCILEKRNNKNA